MLASLFTETVEFFLNSCNQFFNSCRFSQWDSMKSIKAVNIFEVLGSIFCVQAHARSLNLNTIRQVCQNRIFFKLLSASFIPIHPLIAVKTVIVFSSWSHALRSLPMIDNVQKLTPDKHPEEAVSISSIIAITWSYPTWPWCLVSYFCQTLLVWKFIQSSSNHCVSRSNWQPHIPYPMPPSLFKT